MNDSLERQHFPPIDVKRSTSPPRCVWKNLLVACRSHRLDLDAHAEDARLSLPCWFPFCRVSCGLALTSDGETHLPLPLSSNPPSRVCFYLNGRFPSTGPRRPACYKPFSSLTFKSPVETPQTSIVLARARHSLDWFLHPAFLMRDISTLAQLTGSLHKNGLGWGAAQQNHPTALVQENSAQKDWVALSNFKICPLFFSVIFNPKAHSASWLFVDNRGHIVRRGIFFFFSVMLCCRYHFQLISFSPCVIQVHAEFSERLSWCLDIVSS